MEKSQNEARHLGFLFHNIHVLGLSQGVLQNLDILALIGATKSVTASLIEEKVKMDK